jgi:ABC-2 type transport system ATP-binding protein
MDGPAITCRGLAKRYGPVTALHGLDLEIPAGTVFGLLGPNGAGKTTTLRLLTGLASATGGSATVAGVDVAVGGPHPTGVRHDRAGVTAGTPIGYLDQDPRFYGWMRGRELLRLVADLSGMTRADARVRIDEMLQLVGLADAGDRAIGGYSGGMRQRIGLAAALLGRPSVLFLDEPVSALDPAGRHDILEVIRGLGGSTTVVMSSHILNDVERVCDRVGILDHGRLLADANIDDLLERYAQPIYLLEPYPGQEEAFGRLVELIRAQPWVTGVEPDAGTQRVHVADPDTAGRALVALIADAGLGVSRLEMQRPTLEDVFLHIVSGDQASVLAATGSAGGPLP